MNSKIAGVGYYLPETILSNEALSRRIDTTDAWIRERVGIENRRIANAHETNSFMASRAAKNALDHAGISADQLDLIIVATATPDQFMPSVACSVQAEIGANCPAFDLNAACSGFIYAMHTAKQFFDAGTVKHVLIVGSELMSRVMNWSDRSTCVLFGDGAGAIVLCESDSPHFFASKIFANGQYRELLQVSPHFRSEAFSGNAKTPELQMQGNKVFRFAVEKLGEVVGDILGASGMTADQIDWLIPHQANARIITATAKKLNLSMDKVVLTLDQHGNTTAASIPLALAHAVLAGKIKRGDLLLMEAFGAGFVWGANIVKY